MLRQTATTTTMPYPTRPASPTLTNPDMILPYGEYDNEASPRAPSLSQSGTWSGGNLEDIDFAIGSATQTTPIIYGNGTMLSDIGEVTEAESTPKKPLRPAHVKIARSQGSPLRSSPTMGYDAVLKRSKFGSHQRQVSVESTSTVTTEGQAAEMHFEEFDDGVSVDDSNFQGDDEESVVDEIYEHQQRAAVQRSPENRESLMISTTEQGAQSSAALSRRAELILANAKKRLDNMEGNLSRARNSLYITPSSSMSSINSTSPLSRTTPSPQDSERRIVPQLGIPPARHRQYADALPSPSSPGHARIFSESSIPSSLRTPPYDSTSPTAVGNDGSFSGLSQKSSHVEPRENSMTSSRPYHSSSLNRGRNPRASPLEDLTEDSATPSYQTNLERVRPSTAEPYRYMGSEGRGLTRSASSMQMRDLTTKMQDLKGKISTLRDKAREDNVKRLSMQSLGTPSPFTAAEQWSVSVDRPEGNAVKIMDDSLPLSPMNGKPSVINGVAAPAADRAESGHLGRLPSAIPEYSRGHKQKRSDLEDPADSYFPSVSYEHPSNLMEEDENYETAEEMDSNSDNESEDIGDDTDDLVSHEEVEESEDGRSESQASQYHDSLVAQISHEDREDAFDYEHFFLHSAMGPLGLQQLSRRDSTTSFSSEDSVETTRAITALDSYVEEPEAETRTAKAHAKNYSTDSLSTLATFATATEGYSEETADEDREDIPVEIITNSGYERPATPVTAMKANYDLSVEENGSGEDEVTPKKHVSTHANTAPSKGIEKVKRDVHTSSEQPLRRPDSVFPSARSMRDAGCQTTREETPSRRSSLARNPELQKSSMHRPTTSVCSSSGSTPSLPSVNEPKVSTPSAAQETVPVAAASPTKDSIITILNNAMASEEHPGSHCSKDSPLSMLVRDDRILVERLVASLGKCVLGMQDSSRGSTEGRMWRNRLETARRVLEGEALRSAVSIEELRSRRTTGLASRTARGV